MARLSDPQLFSAYVGLDQSTFDNAGLIDPLIDIDTELFIDPVLLEKSSFELIKNDATTCFRDHFEKFVRLLAISERELDPAWLAAQKLLDLREPPENGLGYGSSGRSGSSRPQEVRDSIMRTSKEIIELGSKDPEMISLMGFFEKDVGPDTISDFTTRVIMKQLAQVTEAFCEHHGIPLSESRLLPEQQLPRYVDGKGESRELVLVPQDIVRDLPVANDWSEVESAAFSNAQIRGQVNALLGNIAESTVAQRKEALREYALQSASTFQEFLESVKESADHYDQNQDALAYYKLKSILANGFGTLAVAEQFDLRKGPEELRRVVLRSLEVFKHHVEKGNLWEELWIDDKPKKERAAQLIFYAIADCFCRANDIAVSPEAHMGGGPVDFKFSTGYRASVLVELKRSSGQVRHGYDRQLEIYKEAAQTQYGIFVVMNYGDLGKKLTEIKEIRKARLEAGEQASDIIVIDATKKASASKRT
ncbi:MAG: hypothetical protein AAF354_09050 [Pseudomonadota bacterium]